MRDLCEIPLSGDQKGSRQTISPGNWSTLSAIYVAVTINDVLVAFADPVCAWPKNAILLTFDDGLIDHYISVFPLLDKHGIQGCFYPSNMPIEESKVLDVHKIQFILAAVPDVKALLAQGVLRS